MSYTTQINFFPGSIANMAENEALEMDAMAGGGVAEDSQGILFY